MYEASHARANCRAVGGHPPASSLCGNMQNGLECRRAAVLATELQSLSSRLVVFSVSVAASNQRLEKHFRILPFSSAPWMACTYQLTVLARTEKKYCTSKTASSSRSVQWTALRTRSEPNTARRLCGLTNLAISESYGPECQRSRRKTSTHHDRF